ncbi:MAG: MFS transporter [Candidatus Promineifilaceae bacterium]|jgi:MFS family permease
MKNLSHLTSARLAVLAAFFFNGLILATWVSRIPAVQSKLDMSEGTLGFVLMGISVGVIVALSMAGGLVGRFGSKTMTMAGVIGLCFVMPLPALMPNTAALFAALFIFGAFLSTMDVSMNSQAVVVEGLAGKHLMSSFHAFFSIDGLAGALLGAGFVALGVSILNHFLILALFSLLVMLFFGRFLVQDSGEPEGEGGGIFRLPPHPLWALGAVAFCVAIGEGSMGDWSGVYLAEVIRTTEAFAALGFAAFSATMTLGRLAGDWLVVRFAPVNVVRYGGLLASLGLLTAVFSHNEYVVLLGFAAVGAGVANGIPLAFSAAGKFPGMAAGAGIVGVATIGYAGFLAGPPLIGLVAEATSLRVAFFLAALLVGSLVFSAQAMRQRPVTAVAAPE